MRLDPNADTLRVADLYAPIAEDLERVQQVINDELISDQAFISDLCHHVRQFHGKLLRPAVLLLAGQACGTTHRTHHVLAAVVELVHVATLVHDDLLDEADIRRRAATVSRLWGNERAVLMGDFLFSHAYRLCSTLDSQYAASLIGHTAVTVCEGEMMQVANRGNFELSESEYFDVITRKTATLVATACHLGAWAAGADEEMTQRLTNFGTCLGTAFQIADDLLDLTGDESQVGKSLGRDLSEGELTLPLIHYLRVAEHDRQKHLLGLLREASPRAVRTVAREIRTSESVAYAQGIAAEQIRQAHEWLAPLPPSPARERLSALAEFVLTRRH